MKTRLLWTISVKNAGNSISWSIHSWGMSLTVWRTKWTHYWWMKQRKLKQHFNPFPHVDVFLWLQHMTFKNIVTKGEIAHHEQLSIFRIFSTLFNNCSFVYRVSIFLSEHFQCRLLLNCCIFERVNLIYNETTSDDKLYLCKSIEYLYQSSR